MTTAEMCGKCLVLTGIDFWSCCCCSGGGGGGGIDSRIFDWLQ